MEKQKYIVKFELEYEVKSYCEKDAQSLANFLLKCNAQADRANVTVKSLIEEKQID